MAAKQAVIRKLAEMGITDYEFGYTVFGYELNMWAPQGKIFNASTCHCSVRNTNLMKPTKKEKAEAHDWMLEELAMGMDDCEDPECDYCVGEGNERAMIGDMLDLAAHIIAKEN